MAYDVAGFSEICTRGIFKEEDTGGAFRIRSLTPSIGNIAGGTTVEIYVEALGTDVTSVLFGSEAATIVAQTATKLTVVTPTGVAGNTDVRVSTATLNDTLVNGFLYSSLSIDSPVGNYLEALEAKLKESTIITNPANVVIGESPDIFSMSADNDRLDHFPRLEVLITKDRATGYGSQRNIDFEFRYSIAGYLLRENDAVVTSDMIAIMNFGTEIRALNYQFLDEKQQGNPPCVGFTRLGEYPETFYEYELFPKVTAFVFDMAAFMYLTDTQVA